MNLQTSIPAALWTAVSNAYESENYSHAILEATYLISSVLRDRAGVDGDGAALVGQALGGDDPKLKLTALQTESERNIQKGFEQILRGIYLGIRNPRSHEQSNDGKETADAIIHFIGYILGLLNRSREAFTVDSFVERVFDSEFVESGRYAELLVAEIPKLRLADALIALYKKRKKADLKKLKHLLPVMIRTLNPGQLASYLNVVSEDLRTATDDLTIRTSIQMLLPELWQSVAEIPKLRIENKFINGIREGEIDSRGKANQALATWSRDFLKFFSTRLEAANVLIEGLEHYSAESRHYVAKFFMKVMPEVMVNQNQSTRCIRAIVAAVMDEDANVRSSLILSIPSYPAEWQSALAEGLKSKTDENNPAVYLSDGNPFLAAPTNDEDDIPF